MTKARVVPEAQRAFEALIAFAERNFPAEGSLKGFEAFRFPGGSRLFLAGGTRESNKVVYQPGLYYRYDDSRVGALSIFHLTGPDSRVMDPARVLLGGSGSYRYNESAFISGARDLVDF